MDLKDHFARGATDDIESVFLMAKTNCAFVNYSTEEACKAAQARFHDQRFYTTKLVCRLRQGAPPLETAEMDTTKPDTDIKERDAERVAESHISKGFKERYFVIKSLTYEDLRLSVQTGSWATQSHNEATLTEAFKSADNVYLVFSVDKSGEYFGYARMLSPIDESTTASNVPTPGHLSSLAIATNSWLMTPMPPTDYAPRGYIVDDPARGTIFWEATRGDEGEKKGAEEDAQ